MSYPRGYINKELEKEIDRYGDESPNSHLGPSYYARASLGLTELERRSTKKINMFSLSISTLALVFSFLAVKYSAEQAEYSRIQSGPEQVNLARAIKQALEFCKNQREWEPTSLMNTSSGEQMTCSEVLKSYK
ncbi:MAG: hypothetical protein Q7R69_01810 [bacterium]|nr:hypothetical protein [bacterium]